MGAIKEPSFVKLKLGSKPPPVTRAVGLLLLAATGWAVGYDIADTAVRRASHALRGKRRGRGKDLGAPVVPIRTPARRSD